MRATRLLGRTKSEKRKNASTASDEVPAGAHELDDEAREVLTERFLRASSRRDLFRWGAVAAGGAAAALIAGGALRGALAAPGDALAGTVISNTDIDAKRIAGIRIATEFSPSKHAGTAADPWPGTAIQNAIGDLPAIGGAVFIPHGTWNLSDTLVVGRSSVILSGSGPATKLVTDGVSYVPNVSAMIGVDGLFSGVIIERLLLDGTGTDTNKGIRVADGSDVLIRECELQNWQGVLSQRARGISIEQNPTVTTPPYRQCIVDGCVFRNNQIGVVLHRTYATLTNSRFLDNVWDGAYVDGSESEGQVISGCSFVNSGRYGVGVIFANGAIVANNHFYGNDINIGLNEAKACAIIGNLSQRGASQGIYLATNCRENTIMGNVAYDQFGPGMGADTHGLYLFNGCRSNAIIGNVCYRNDRGGIGLYASSDRNIVKDNLCFNNDQRGGFAGIFINNSSGNVVEGNKCFDDQATKTQEYGVAETNGADANFILGNDFRDNLLGAVRLIGPNTVVRRNLGHQTETRGVATILAGTSSIVVSHGLVGTPALVTLGPRHAEVAGSFVSSRDSANLTIAVASPVTVDRAVDWYAEV